MIYYTLLRHISKIVIKTCWRFFKLLIFLIRFTSSNWVRFVSDNFKVNYFNLIVFISMFSIAGTDLEVISVYLKFKTSLFISVLSEIESIIYMKPISVMVLHPRLISKFFILLFSLITEEIYWALLSVRSFTQNPNLRSTIFLHISRAMVRLLIPLSVILFKEKSILKTSNF